MTNNDDVSLERIREYLGRLTSQARSNLLVEIERIQLYGDDVPGSETILTQLRAEFRKSGQSHDRAGSPSKACPPPPADPGCPGPEYPSR